MRSQFPRFFARSWFFVLGCACVILAAGCAAGGDVAFDPADLFYRETATLPIIASARPTRTPTITATPIYTASPTMTATPTQTPVPIVTPTYEPVNVWSFPTALGDNFSLQSDVTIPDGETLERGAVLLKSWRIKNTGSSVWNEKFSLVRVDSFPFDAPQRQRAVFLQPTELIELKLATWNARQFTVAPGTTVDLVVPFRVPTQPGSYRIEYYLVNDRGEIVGTKLWMSFEIPFEAGELTATAEEEIRLSATPDPLAEAERPEIGTVMPMTVKTIDWSGKWLIRDPFIEENTIPVEAEFGQQGHQLSGYFYDRNGEPVLIEGTLSDDTLLFTGRVGYAWERKFINVQWRVLADGNQFSSITDGGRTGYGASCGGRNGAEFPEYCSVPPGV